MTTTNQAFINAFARASAPRESTQASAAPSELRPHSDFGGARAQVDESSYVGAQNQTVARPHVQFPADIQIDADDRRHTRIDGRVDYDSARTPTNDRRPLSEFTNTESDSPLRAAYEVDQFAWPTLCEKIANASKVELDALVERIISFANTGDSVISVVANKSSVGCTTATLTLARRMATVGARVVLVDGAFAAPALAAQLGLSAAHGWDDVLLDDAPLADALIHSVADKITLAPLRCAIECDALRRLVHDKTILAVIRALRFVFDVVLIDAGDLFASSGEPQTSAEFLMDLGTDGAVVVTDSESTGDPSDTLIENQLRALGIPILGAIRNFVR